MINKHFLQQALLQNNFHLSDETQHQFIHYLALLEEWNRVFNLTAIRDPNDMIMLHILDSLSIHTYLHGQRIIDVGTGAGLPGIPLALIHPEKKFVLLDSNSKKTRFLTQVKLELKLQNVDIVHSRCEDFCPVQGFNSILSRAFASIQVMLATTKHLAAKDCRFLAMKGVHPTQELAEIPNNFIVLTADALQIKGLDANRHIVCIKEREWEK